MALLTCPRCGRQVASGRFCPGCGSRLDDPLAGKVLGGKWRLDAQTARGPFFSTYRAEPKSGGAAVAVKVLDPGLAEDDARRRRFLENAGAGLAMADARLLAIREMAEEGIEGLDGRSRRAVYAVTEAPAGPSLGDLVRGQGALDPARAAVVVRGLLEALGAVHGAGLIHGDLHPGCVFVQADGSGREAVRLADAGLARGLAVAAGADGVDPATLGSDGGRWIAPEQASGVAPGAAADLHAVGALLYFALTGVPPWQAEKGSALLFEIQRSFPRAPSEVRPGVPASLDAAVDRALAKGPADRFRSAEEFARALEEVAAGAAPVAASDLPADVTPGAFSLDAVLPDPLPDATMAAGPGPAAPESTYTADPREERKNSGDETLLAPRPQAPPPAPRPAAPRGRPTPPIPTEQSRAAQPSRQERPSGAPPLRAATPRPAPKPAAAPSKPAAAGAPAKPAVPAPAAPARTAKVRGAWSVGTPVAVFAILGFLGAGALYGMVWSGKLGHWDLPKWVRALAQRDEVPHIPDSVTVPPQSKAPVLLNVEVPQEVRYPVSGEGKDAVYGSWRLVKDPVDETAAAGGAAAPEKVFAMGDLRGDPGQSGVLPVRLTLPAGKYRLGAELRYADVDRGENRDKDLFEVRDGPVTKSFNVLSRRAVLKVRTRPEIGKVKVARSGKTFEMELEVVPGVGEVVFSGPEFGGLNPLRYGDKVNVTVTADGYRRAEQTVDLLQPNQVLEIPLVEDPGNKVTEAVKEIRKDGRLSPRYQNDPAVFGAPEVMVELASICARKNEWARVESYLENIEVAVGEKPLPTGAEDLLNGWHLYLRDLATTAAKRGDLLSVRELRAKSRPERLGNGAAAERDKWAAIEVEGWLNFPPAAERKEVPEEGELGRVARMVAEDLKSAAPDRRRAVAERLLQYRAWPAWREGTELRPAKDGEKVPVPGPDPGAWLALAKKAWPEGDQDPAFLLSCQRLEARLKDLDRHPEEVAALLVGDAQWAPGKTIPESRIDALPKKDRLLLARALARWGHLRRAEGNDAEAARLWNDAWGVYQNCFEADEARDYPRELALAARFEGARMALLTKGNDTARGALDDYLKALDEYLGTHEGDPAARGLRDALVRLNDRPLEPTERMKSLGLRMVPIPGGVFRTGSDEPRSPTEERPFSGGDATPVPVNVLPPRDFLVREFLVSDREVTVRVYGRYLEEMADPAKAKLYRHPQEPAEKAKENARVPAGFAKWGSDEPVRGVDWWDAWACTRFLGGRLPTEAEWEMAARRNLRHVQVTDWILAIKAALGGRWPPGFWPEDAKTLGPLDFAPSGAAGFLGGVAEWTMDPFAVQVAGPGGSLAECVARVPPEMKAGAGEVVAVRGGSFYHRAPGEDPGESAADKREATAEGAAREANPAAAKQTLWRGLDLLERRGLAANRHPRWVGFRVVLGPAAEKPR